MRSWLFAAALACLAAVGCAPRSQPYRFSMPMLGHADVPPSALPAPTRKPMSPPRSPSDRTAVASRSGAAAKPRPHYAYGWQIDAQAGIRVTSAKGVELTVPEASAESAAAVPTGVVYSRLPAPNKPPTSVMGAMEATGLIHIHEAADLRHHVGRRDKREPLTVVLGWLADLGLANDELLALGSGAELVTWAEPRSALLPPSTEPLPGDLLVFDRAVTNEPSDLVALVIGRDTRGVTEMAYVGGGVVRRGFVDPARPSTRRDLNGAVINTFLRHGKQWPAEGTKCLAGELLVHVIRVH